MFKCSFCTAGSLSTFCSPFNSGGKGTEIVFTSAEPGVSFASGERYSNSWQMTY